MTKDRISKGILIDIQGGDYYENQPHRFDRIERVINHIYENTPDGSLSHIRGNLKSLSDHKGTLIAGWGSLPLETGAMAAVEAGWISVEEFQVQHVLAENPENIIIEHY